VVVPSAVVVSVTDGGAIEGTEALFPNAAVSGEVFEKILLKKPPPVGVPTTEVVDTIEPVLEKTVSRTCDP
jgi:hypothetical protein